jgi:glycosyltransferase involved in cell wall biosynthesis
MRILLFSHTYLPFYYRGKLRWLATHGGVDLILATVATLRLPTGPCLAFERAPEPFAVRLLQPLFFPNHNNLRLYIPHQVINLLRETHPDLVHIEAEPHSLSLGIMALLKPVFGYRLVAFTWENIQRRGRKPLGWIEPYTLSRVDWMITGNQEASAVVRWRGYQGPITVIPQVGIDPVHFQATATPASPFKALPPGIRIGFVGRLVSQKGVSDLLEAFLPLADRACLVLIGEGPLRETIRRRTEACGCSDKVLLTGFVSYQEMPAYLKGLDILVLPSRTIPHWKEQFGHVLAEAMAAEVAVIGSDSGAIPEVIGKTGLLFPEGDIEALRGHLVYLIEHPDERQRLADAGRQRALALFSDASIGQNTLQVYRQVLEVE